MCISPTPTEGVERWDENAGNYSPSEGGHGVTCGKTRLQVAFGAVVPLRTF